ncbi:hypothetical protein [Pseudomonas frederiksbergensis]|uniref:hypothetical protein n=1 Tax=Pseudomonas frederiksbergensis TaxID=104087 RepID=UPI000F49E2E8|nr:hypothetical protein [Pseudomonas frederiksbergensis]
MALTLTAGVEVGKQSKKIERNTRKGGISEILLLGCGEIVFMFAWGLDGAQLTVDDSLPVTPPSRASPLPHFWPM